MNCKDAERASCATRQRSEASPLRRMAYKMGPLSITGGLVTCDFWEKVRYNADCRSMKICDFLDFVTFEV